MTPPKLDYSPPDAAELASSEEWVVLYHPGVDGVHRTTLEAYNSAWRHKGWLVLEDAVTKNKISKERLEAVAEEHGLDVEEIRGGKSAILDKILQAEGATPTQVDAPPVTSSSKSESKGS